ncbi:MAG: DUF5677 domain-containing protein [Candidatus Electrothrix aestuarii]|uniref:DUF5677 domain-containing protein n=1 Tax=Candidatus Electrothrix aestuarii TaxID=3062594 RepID=A0AAU8LTN0_9BACT|nr:DUF5677 domain-containing protein [Candidatus Electrothrix aestuarii]
MNDEELSNFLDGNFSYYKNFPSSQAETFENVMSIALELPSIFNLRQEDIDEEYFYRILGVHYSIIGIYDAIFELSVCGHSSVTYSLLRMQMENFLILIYLTEDKNNLAQVNARIEEYEDWIKIKMFQNNKRSKNFDLYRQFASSEKYTQTVKNNYLLTKEKYSLNINDFKALEKRPSFLKDKRKIAQLVSLEEVYDHIVADGSATIHCADLYDKIDSTLEEDTVEYSFNIRPTHYSPWVLLLSNFLIQKQLLYLADFFHLSEKKKNELKNTLFRDTSEHGNYPC